MNLNKRILGGVILTAGVVGILGSSDCARRAGMSDTAYQIECNESKNFIAYSKDVLIPMASFCAAIYGGRMIFKRNIN
jgi:hypothetical protein